MSAPVALDPARSVLDQLRERVSALEGAPARLPLPTHPGLAGLVDLRAGGSYGVDSASLALALAAGASRSGEWVGFAGWDDFGAEAAEALGLDLARTVLVPEPGEHWREVTAALVDVLRVVVLRPPVDVDAASASRIEARLRTRSAALVVWGQWPRCEARLRLEQVRWTGPERGRGALRQRRATLAVSRGTAPPVRTDVLFPGEREALEPLAAREGRAGHLERVGASAG